MNGRYEVRSNSIQTLAMSATRQHDDGEAALSRSG